jgi:flagellar hook-length control protein FliK
MSATGVAMLSPLPAVAGPGPAGTRTDVAPSDDGAGFAAWLGGDVAAEPAPGTAADDAAQLTAAVDLPVASDAAIAPSPPATPPPASPLMGAMLQALSVREDGASLREGADVVDTTGARRAGAAAAGAAAPSMPWSNEASRLLAGRPADSPLPGAANAASAEPASDGALAPMKSPFGAGIAALMPATSPATGATPVAPSPAPLATQVSSTSATSAAIAAIAATPAPEARSELPAAARGKPVGAAILAPTSGVLPGAATAPPPADALASTMLDASLAGQGSGAEGVEQLPTAQATTSPLTSSMPGGATTPAPSAMPVMHAVRADGALPPVQAPLGSPLWGNEFASRVVAMVREDLAEAEIHVNPQDLGPIEVKIRIEGDRLHAQFGAVSAEAREALTANLHRLREMLAGDGLQLGQAFVGHHGAGTSGERGGGSPQSSTLRAESSDAPGDEPIAVRGPRGDRDALLDEFA